MGSYFYHNNMNFRQRHKIMYIFSYRSKDCFQNNMIVCTVQINNVLCPPILTHCCYYLLKVRKVRMNVLYVCLIELLKNLRYRQTPKINILLTIRCLCNTRLLLFFEEKYNSTVNNLLHDRITTFVDVFIYIP
jgi:hypothetical protein